MAAPVIKEPVVQGDPATCQIAPGRETRIEIQKGKSGLGLSIVGGADTLLVRHRYRLLLHPCRRAKSRIFNSRSSVTELMEPYFLLLLFRVLS